MKELILALENFNSFLKNNKGNSRKIDKLSKDLQQQFNETLNKYGVENVFNSFVTREDEIGTRAMIVFLNDENYRDKALKRLKYIRENAVDNHASLTAKIALYAWE